MIVKEDQQCEAVLNHPTVVGAKTWCNKRPSGWFFDYTAAERVFFCDEHAEIVRAISVSRGTRCRK